MFFDGSSDKPSAQPAPEEGSHEWRAELIRSFPDKRLKAKEAAPPAAAKAAKKEGERTIATREKSLAKLDRYKTNWPTADKLQEHAATGSGGFQPSETCKLTGETVNLRRDDGSVEKRLSRGSTLTVSAPLQRIQVLEEVFIRVQDKSGKAGYVAERYLKPIEARKEVVAQRKGKLETTDEAMFREVVLHHLDDVFGKDEDLKDPAKRKLKAQRDGLYVKWDAGYSTLLRKGFTGEAFDEGVKKLYRDLFGSTRDIFEEKVQLELKLAAGARKAGTEVVSTNPDPDQALDEALGKLGYEIGIYFGRGKMTAAEIREAFNIPGPPRDSANRLWGDPGSRVIFSYTDGKLYFYPPKASAVSERVPLDEAKYAWAGGEEGAPVRLEGQRFVTREKTIGVRQPQDAVMEATREKRSAAFVALRAQYQQSQAS